MAHHRALRYALPALLLSGSLLVSGCGGGATAGPSPTGGPSSEAATADPRPTPASSTAPARNVPVPALPEAAKQNTREGFEAFVRHYIDLLDYAYQTGDTKPALAVADPGCNMCNTITKDASTISVQSWLVGGRLQASEISVDASPDIDSIWLAYLSLTQAPYVDYAPTGPLATTSPSPLKGLVARGEFTEGAWRMFDLGTPKGAKK
ncbi:DUF6318 family protein [Sinomonas sp. B1-1]|uniref:DUF6318 family protein n=1 Tax=Sinomonas sp. B1-1 TaxID=3141454 RepID=UPI003D2B4EFD